ncbi:MAG: DUF169 domain-containing protein [Vulcanisaeta sp.]
MAVGSQEVLERYKRYSNDLMEILRLRTKPVGVALLDRDPDEADISAFRPLRHFRRKLTFCQMTAAARYYGMGMVATLEDMACPGEIIIFGFAEPPDYFLDGSLSHGLYTRTKETGKALDNSLPRLPVGKYKALLTMPLDNIFYEPQVVMIYGTPGQMVKLVAAYVYISGDKVTLSASGKAGSDTAVVEVLLTGKPRLALPGYGDRIVGHVEDYEMLFVTPASLLGDLIDALKEQNKTNFIIYPPMPSIFYRVDFSAIPVIGHLYDRFLREIDEKVRREKGGAGEERRA